MGGADDKFGIRYNPEYCSQSWTVEADCFALRYAGVYFHELMYYAQALLKDPDSQALMGIPMAQQNLVSSHSVGFVRSVCCLC
jgi:hypothetical protein